MLHVVLYPRYKYDLPILAMDMVVVPGGRVSLAIVDACPVSKNLALPPHYMQVGGWVCTKFHLMGSRLMEILALKGKNHELQAPQKWRTY